MTVREAGRLGGLIGGRKGGLAVKAERGVEFYQEIGRLGGQRVRDLIAAGRKAAERSRRRTGARAGR
jgi:general stress protein YciG